MFREGVEKNNGEVKQINAFHNNTGSFYNRHILNKSLGFDEFYSIEKMKEYGVSGEWSDVEDWGGEKNLDSVAVEKMQDVMFPRTSAGEQYMSYFLTFVMHGFYGERQSFKDLGYYDLLDSVGAYPKGISVDDDYLRNYAACVMDFDKAVGTMMNRLEENGDLDNTTIVMFADHNAYYSNLCFDVKGTKKDDFSNTKSNQLPCIIYNNELPACVNDTFCNTYDLYPTICDLMGLSYNKSLTQGYSIYSDEIVDSVFVSSLIGMYVDNIFTSDLEEIVILDETVTQGDVDKFRENLFNYFEKQKIIESIYRYNYFGKYA